MSKLAPDQSVSNPKLEEALSIAEAGLPVFPIWRVLSRATADVPAVCSCRKGAECKQPGKHPRTWRGHLDASTDADTIRSWWSRPGGLPWESDEQRDAFSWQCDPDSNVGIAIPEGLVIVDVDPRNGGNETLAKICAEHGKAWLDTLTVKTGGAGIQAYFACEPGRRFPKNLGSHFGPGIDLKQRCGSCHS
jgi:hypothetical protein